MKRLYYLCDQMISVESISKELQELGVGYWNFQVICNDEAGLKKRHIHSASPLEKLDIIHSGERGALMGFSAAIFITLAMYIFAPFSQQLGLGIFALIIMLITLFGAWVGGMVGVSHENYKISQFHHDIEAGKYLIIVDVKKEQESQIKEIMKQHHPESELKGEDNNSSNPFVSAKSSHIYTVKQH